MAWVAGMCPATTVVRQRYSAAAWVAVTAS
jgi:hypothetical protein